MNINELSETDLQAFLALLGYVGNFSESISDSEKTLLSKYCDIKNVDLDSFLKMIDEAKASFKLEDALSYFKDKSNEVKRLVYYDLYEFVIADYIIFDDEMEVVEKLRDSLGLSVIEYKTLEEEAMSAKQKMAVESAGM
ncbi:MAG: hypothetical protein K6D02_03300 [Lachnospiraceae bacterium]|nr:hypothetical protein [Lachnospiraceae bacterium]